MQAGGKHPMDDSERLDALRLFIGALVRVLGGPQVIPFDPASFASAVAEGQGKGDEFAQKFALYTTIAGSRCPDFQEGLTLAQAAGLISRQNPTYTSFVPRMPARQLRRLETSDAAFQGAEKLARNYSRLVGLTVGGSTTA
jgi:hypothetical protein